MDIVDQKRVNEDVFDTFIDKLCASGSPWTYEEAVHIASGLYDDAGHHDPYPSDYVPKERRRLVTGGA